MTDDMRRQVNQSIACGFCKVRDLCFLDQRKEAHVRCSKSGDEAVSLGYASKYLLLLNYVDELFGNNDVIKGAKKSPKCQVALSRVQGSTHNSLVPIIPCHLVIDH